MARITRTDGKTGRFYTIPNADGTTAKYPSVTTILSAIAKPALVGWAAKEERTMVSTAAADLYADLAASPQLPRSMYTLALEQRLGTTKAHVKALAQASDIGTATHAKIEWVLKTQLLGVAAGPGPVLSEGAQRAFLAFEEWARLVRLRPQLIEQTVFSRTHEFAGTMDLLATLDSAALLSLLEHQGAVDAALAEWLRARAEVTALIDFKTGKGIYSEAHLQSVAYQRALAEMGHGRVDGALIVRLPKTAQDAGFEVAVVPPARELFPTFLAVRQLWQWQFQQDEAWRARNKRAVA
jgi:predicted DCC family thiol-disulfide oxidoreductase YuxK